jgi:ankyrin repeat protein
VLLQVGSTPLHYAAYGGHVGAVTVLLDAGADINAQNNASFFPLHVVHHKRVELTLDDTFRKSLLYRCLLQLQSGITPLTLAIEQMHRQVEVLMRERGATQLVDDCD